MLEKVMIIFENDNREGLRGFQELEADLRQQRIEVIEISMELASKKLSQMQEKRNGLVVIDSLNEAVCLKEYKVPCMIYAPDSSKYRVYGLDMIIESFEGIDTRFLHTIYNRHYGIPCIIGDTKRLLIRESVTEDLDDFYRLYEGNSSFACISSLNPDREEERRQLESYIQKRYKFYGYGLWSVIEKSSGELIGRIGFEHTEYKEKTVVELGYLVGTPYQRKGYAYEASEAAMKYGKEYLGFDCVFIRAESENTASRRLAEKLGFQMEQTGVICYYCKKP